MHKRPMLAVVVTAALAFAIAFALTPPTTTSASISGAGSNLLKGVDATFDGAVGHWTAVNASVTSASQPTNEGSGALAITTIPTGPVNATAYSGTGPTTWLPAVPGDRYEATMWVRAASTGRTVTPLLGFYDSSGKALDVAWGQALVDDSTTWQQTVPTVGIAPANAAFVAVDATIYNSVAGETHYLDSASVTSKTINAAPIVAPLHTSGNNIVDGNGSRVVFRGLHRNGFESSPTVTNFSSDEITHAQQWGANFVRISLGEQFWLSTNCLYDPTYASKIDSMVDWITSRGMVALLDLHFNTISASSCTNGAQHDMADPDAVSFWSQLASRYRSNPLVAFDLYNEPHGISDDVWLHGGMVTEGGTQYQAIGMQQLYDTVRATGATNLVVVSGNNWASRLPATLVYGSNIVYAAHAYTCPSTPPPTCAATSPLDPSTILSRFVNQGQTVPIMVTEFGWPNKYDGTYNANVIAFAEAQGWGWNVFAWDGRTTGTFDLVTSVGPASGYEPSPSGDPVVIGLEKNAASVPGAPTSVMATGGNGVATVSWNAPSSTGGSSITSYTVSASPGGATVTTADGTARTATLNGLANGTAYVFTVHATNAVGSGEESAPSNTVTPTAPVPSSALTVKSPNGGETWAADKTGTISWSTQQVSGNVRIELLRQGSVVATITPGTAASKGTYSWRIPKSLSKGSTYAIRITSVTSPTINDTSDRTFSIV